jgi:kinesin family protein 3/17
MQTKKEEQFSSLQEEIEDKNKKLKKVYTKVQEIKDEIKDEQESWGREKEILIQELREYSRELKLKMLIIDHFIPMEILQTIEEKAMYNQEIDDWLIPNMHMTGNSIRAANGEDPNNPEKGAVDMKEEIAVMTFEGHPNVYYVYTEEGPMRAEMQAPKEKKARAKTAMKKPGSAKPKDGQMKRQKDESLYPKAKGLVKK